MARKKNNPEAQRAQMLANSSEIAELINLDHKMSIKEKANFILEEADKTMTEICNKADSIKIDGWNQVAEILAETTLMDKRWFLELVEIRKDIMLGKSQEEIADKYKTGVSDQIDWLSRQAIMKKQFYEDMSNKDSAFSKLAISEIDVDNPTETELDESSYLELPEEVKTIIEDCAKTRNYINTVLWPRLHKFADCFAIECQAESWEFYDLLKWFHYRQGGYPLPGSAPKLWDIINKFQYALRQMDKYGIEFGRQYCERAGLKFEFVHECEDSFHNWDL